MAHNRIGFSATPKRRDERHNIRTPLIDKKSELTIKNDMRSPIFGRYALLFLLMIMVPTDHPLHSWLVSTVLIFFL